MFTAPAVKHLKDERQRHTPLPLRARSLNARAPSTSTHLVERSCSQPTALQRSFSAVQRLCGEMEALTTNGELLGPGTKSLETDGSKGSSAIASQQLFADENADSHLAPDHNLATALATEEVAAVTDGDAAAGDAQPGTADEDATPSNAAADDAPNGTDQGEDQQAAPLADAGPAGLAPIDVERRDSAGSNAAGNAAGSSPTRLVTPKVARDDSWPAITLDSPAATPGHHEEPSAAAGPASAPVWNSTPVPAAVEVAASPKAASPMAEALPPLPPKPATPKTAATASAPAAQPSSEPSAAHAPAAYAKEPAAAGEVVRASDKVDEVRESPVKVSSMAQQLSSPAATPPKVPAASTPGLSREPSATKTSPLLSTHDTVNTVNVAVKLQSGDFARKPGVDFVAYEELVTLRLEDGIDATRKEDYLTDVEFDKVFGMNRAAYQALPQWKKLAMKKEVRLF